MHQVNYITLYGNGVKRVDLPTTFPALFFLTSLKARPLSLFTNYWKIMLKFGEWYASMVFANCNDSLTPAPLDLRLHSHSSIVLSYQYCW